MENKLTFCDYLNHPNFMKIEDKNDRYEIIMKASVNHRDNNFYDANGNLIAHYKYIVMFHKNYLWSRID